MEDNDFKAPEGIARPEENNGINIGGYWNDPNNTQGFTPTAQQPKTTSAESKKNNESRKLTPEERKNVYRVRNMTPEEKARAAQDGKDIAAGKTVIDFDRERRESINNRFTYPPAQDENTAKTATDDNRKTFDTERQTKLKDLSGAELARLAQNGKVRINTWMQDGKKHWSYHALTPEEINKGEEYWINYNKEKRPELFQKSADSKVNTSNANSSAGNTETSSNADINRMINKINYMNKINGEDKAIDAAEKAQKLYELYGDKAVAMLDKAIMEPSNYAKTAGADIKLSREAVEHLAGIDKEYAKEFSEKMLGNAAAQEKGNETFSALQQAGNKIQDDKRMADAKSIMDMAMSNPEQYQQLKNMYQNLFDGKLPGFEIAEYFLDIMQKVEGILTMVAEDQQKSGAEQTAADSNKTADTSTKSEEDKKREEDKKSCRDLYAKDKDKFAKAKDSYEGIIKNGGETEKAQARYYLDIMQEVEKENSLKETMQKDAKAAEKKSDREIENIKDYSNKTQDKVSSADGKESSGNTLQGAMKADAKTAQAQIDPKLADEIERDTGTRPTEPARAAEKRNENMPTPEKKQVNFMDIVKNVRQKINI